MISNTLIRRASVLRYVKTYTQGDGRIGVIIEFECPDEITYQTAEFQEFALNTALQIVAFGPDTVSPTRSQALLDQPFVKDHSKLFKDVWSEAEKQLGVVIHVRRFVRYGDAAL